MVIIDNSCEQFFYYGEQRIAFHRATQQAENSKIAIKVHPNCQVVVSAPEHTSDAEVIQRIKQKSRWIYQQLQTFGKQNELLHNQNYISGATHYYLGRRYLLKIIIDAEQPQSVKLIRGQLQVIISTDTTVTLSKEKVVKTLLDTWYKTRAKDVFRKRMIHLIANIAWVDTPPPIKLLTMKTQWGSCSAVGSLVLNPHLVKAPRECVDYVLLHELCHLVEHNHSERFYRLLTQVMPTWKTIKTQLDEKVGLYIVV